MIVHFRLQLSIKTNSIINADPSFTQQRKGKLVKTYLWISCYMFVSTYDGVLSNDGALLNGLKD